MTITANSLEETYNGTTWSVSGFKNTVEEKGVAVEAGGKTYYVTGLTSEASGKNVSDSVALIPYTGTAVVCDADGNNVSDQFNVKVNQGHLTIKPRELTLVSANLSRAYNGEALTNAEAASLNVTVNASGLLTEDGWAGEDGATYAFTGSQTLVGNTSNAFTVTKKDGTDLDNYAITKTEGDLTVTDGTLVDPSAVMSKTHDSRKYNIGEQVEFTISVTNIYDKYQNITITEQKNVNFTSESTFKDVAPGETVTATAEYTITEDDIKAGTYTNTATARFSDGRTVSAQDVVETADKMSALTVDKIITNEGFVAGTTKFNVGDTINYKITVSNIGNQTLNNIPVQDVTTGKGTVKIEKVGLFGTNLLADYTVDGTNVTIKALAPGQSAEIHCTYVVVSDDKGTTVTNAAIAGSGDIQKRDEVPADINDNGDNGGGNNGGGNNGGGGGGSSSGGGGGSSSGPRDNGSTPSGGPGATTVTIDPDAVPLANLPNEDGAADLLVIDDEDVPLAALPKTGQSGASGLVLFLSSMMLAAFVAVSKKREDDK